MKLTKKVQKILANYESDNPGTKANLARILMNGKLGGTGKVVILPVDQGFEHGPGRSFQKNPEAYDPHYHFSIAIDAGLSAYAAPLGMLEAGASTFAGSIPLILKVNSSNSLVAKSEAPHQAITSSVHDALRLGCSAIGFTIYPGSENSLAMMEQIREMAEEAKHYGLAVVIWAYPRGGDISKEGETALDVISYGAHMACLLGAHIVKVKPPKEHIELEANKLIYHDIPKASLVDRIAHVKKCCFDGRRIVVFSGGEAKADEDIFAEVKMIHDGGGNGSIIGRNTFQRPRKDALDLLNKIIGIYKN